MTAGIVDIAMATPGEHIDQQLLRFDRPDR